MQQIFLTSSVHAVAHHIAKKLNLSQKNSLVFITTPAEPKSEKGDDLQWLCNDRQSLVDAGFTVTDYTITGKLKNQLERDLEKFDYIYMSGGDTFYLLEQSQKSGFFELIQDYILKYGKIYIGTSAGSIIAGEKCPDYLLSNSKVHALKNRDGYGLVNFTILPHWGSEHFKERYLDTRLKIAYRKDQVPLLLLTDTQYVEVNDGKMAIVDVKEKNTDK